MQPSTNSIRYNPFLLLLVLGATLGFTAPTSLLAGQGAAPQQPPSSSPSVWAAPPANQQPSAFQSACGAQPMCYDTPNFAVAVIDFRMSMSRGAKVMDATLRFVNKTNQPLILGYLDNSAVALDDQGNRYGTYYNTGLSGIGLVNGMTMDPKFILQPGGAGDARFELYWRPGAQDPIGSVFDLGMTIREIATLPGGQHTLGGEFPLHFQGLANGAVGTAPSYAAGGSSGASSTASSVFAGSSASLPPCGPSSNPAGAVNAIAGAANSVGGQQTTNATNAATNTTGNAIAQIASLKSIFRKKNSATPATNVAGAANCIPAATPSAMPVAAGPSSSAPATAGQVLNGTTAAPAAATPASPAPAVNARAVGANPAPNAGVPAVANKAAAPTDPSTNAPARANTGAKPTVINAVPPHNAAAKPVVVNTAANPAAAKPPSAVNPVAPNAKPAAQPATTTPAPAATKKTAPPPPAKKPAPAATPAKPANK